MLVIELVYVPGEAKIEAGSIWNGTILYRAQEIFQYVNHRAQRCAR